MTAILHSIDIEAKLESLSFSTSTAEMSYHDTEVARFVERAVLHDLGPSVIEARGRMFPWFVPEAHWDTPMWVHWLGDNYSHAVDELARVRPVADMHYSTDLWKCREMLCWNTSGDAFCSSARGLMDSLRCAYDQEVLAVFISPERFACNLVHVSDELLAELNVMAYGIRNRYQPESMHSSQDLRTALSCSVLFGNEPRVDDEGREIVLLKKRAVPLDWAD
jgi:hypothetical protein